MFYRQGDTRHVTTMQWADGAFSIIRLLKVAATPANYELLYAYECGTPPSLRDKLGPQITEGAISQPDLDSLHRAYFGRDASSLADSSGAKVCSSAKTFSETIESASASAELNRERLSQICELLNGKNDSGTVN